MHHHMVLGVQMVHEIRVQQVVFTIGEFVYTE
jgi:hypothetical protein